MDKTSMHIEIVSSTIPGLSSMSKPSRDAAQRVLSLHYTDVIITIINNLAELEALVARKPDLVFLGMKFLIENPALGAQDSPKIWLSEYLHKAGIVFTGSRRIAHELDQHKPLAKLCVQNAGVKTSPFIVFKKNSVFSEQDVEPTYPLFVKPTSSGGGTGVDEKSLVHNFEELHAKVTSIGTNYSSDSLVERYLSGREFSVAILTDEITGKLTAMPIELEASTNENGEGVLSQAVKSSNTEVVSGISEGAIKDSVVDLALRAFSALGARDYGRIDIRLDSNDVPHFLEANLIPSLIDGYGSFPKACHINQDMDYETMMMHIVGLALQRRTFMNIPLADRRSIAAHIAPVS